MLWNNQPDREAFGLVRKGVGQSTVLRAVETPYPKVNPIQSNPGQLSVVGLGLDFTFQTLLFLLSFQIYLKWKPIIKSHSEIKGKISKNAFIVMFVLLILVVQVDCSITNRQSTRACLFSAANVTTDFPRNTI